MGIEIEGEAGDFVQIDAAQLDASKVYRPGVMKNFDPDALNIDKNVAMPAAVSFDKGPSKWIGLLNKMAIGDSVFLKDTTMAKVGYVRAIAKTNGMAVSMRVRDNGIRMWRVALPVVTDDGL